VVPAILSRRVDNNEVQVDLGQQWGKHLLEGNDLRNKVMHSALGEPLPRVTKKELVASAKAVFAYFEELTIKLPDSFNYMNILLKDVQKLTDEITAI